MCLCWKKVFGRMLSRSFNESMQQFSLWVHIWYVLIGTTTSIDLQNTLKNESV